AAPFPRAVCRRLAGHGAARAARLVASPAPGARRLRRRHPAGRQPVSRPLQSMPGAAVPRLRVEYARAASPTTLLGDDTLAVFGFGDVPHAHDDPRYLRVPLMPHGIAPFEVWHANAPVLHGREPGPAHAGGAIRWATDGQLLFG